MARQLKPVPPTGRFQLVRACNKGDMQWEIRVVGRTRIGARSNKPPRTQQGRRRNGIIKRRRDRSELFSARRTHAPRGELAATRLSPPVRSTYAAAIPLSEHSARRRSADLLGNIGKQFTVGPIRLVWGYPFNRTNISWGGGSPSCRHALSEVRGRIPGLVPHRCRLRGLPRVAAVARWLRLRGVRPRRRVAAG